MRIVVLVLGLLCPGLVFAQQQPLTVVPNLDLQKYAGRWYEIARFPNRFQEKCGGDVTAEYQPQPDGRIAVIKYLWVLARTPSLDEATYNRLLEVAASQGLTSKLMKTAQTGTTY